MAHEVIKYQGNNDVNNQNEIYELRVTEKFDSDNRDEITSVFNDLLAKGAKNVLVDFSELDYIESLSIGVILKYQKLFSREKGELVITGCRNKVLSVFKFVNIDKMIRFFKTEKEGIDYFSGK